MNRDKLIRVVNRATGRTGYIIPELHVKRYFEPKEEKQIPFKELEQLSYMKGGRALMNKYLVVRDREAIRALSLKIEPEYFYDIKDIKRILTTGSYDEFLDFLDFAPDGCIDILEEMAVQIEINDLNKRKALQQKTGLNITQAIEIKNTKYDGDTNTTSTAEPEGKKRRVQSAAPVEEKAMSPRRTTAQVGGFVIPE